MKKPWDTDKNVFNFKIKFKSGTLMDNKRKFNKISSYGEN